MNSHPADLDEQNDHRWTLRLLIALAAVLQLTRILQVQSNTGEVPFLSANDRSRWCTVASLAVNGNYEIDDVLELRDPKTKRRTWYSIDLVQHRGPDGKQHFYSSKPPLLPTLFAGVYMAVRSITGSTLMNDPFFVARVILCIVNWVPLILFWWLMLQWLLPQLESRWAQVCLTVFLGFGTFLSTFSNSLNNHLPAAISVGISIWCLDRVLLKQDQRWRWFVLAGLATSFACANELPALSWVAATGAMLLLVNPTRTLAGYVPALLPVAIAFFGCNYAAHGEWKPAYAHRDAGPRIVALPLGDLIADTDAQRLEDNDLADIDTEAIAQSLREFGQECSAAAVVRPARRPKTWELWDEENETRFALRLVEDAGGSQLAIHQWGDWYDYPKSYWLSGVKQGVDRGEPSRGVYILQSLIGHHGVFSLTPFWLVSVWGFACVLMSSRISELFKDRRLQLALAVAATTAVVLGFYFARGLEDRNYGGVSSGFRWSFWLIPLWLWMAVIGMQNIRSSRARRLVEIAIVASAFSALFPWRNPWTSPWIMQYWEYLGWL